MKNLIISLAFILGMGLLLSTTTSCSEQNSWEDLEQLTIDIFKNQGSAHLLVEFTSRYNEEHQIDNSANSLTLIKAEVKTITITALEENTAVRINGYIIYLDEGEQYIWSSTD